MTDQFVTIATFDSPIEAHIVLGVLEGELIRGMLSGENAAAVFAGMGYAQITLLVHQEDVVRADAVLDDYQDEKDDPSPTDDDDEDGWVCSLCGEMVDDLVTICPSCQTQRGAGGKEAIAKEPRRPRRSGMERLNRAPDNAVQRLDQISAAPFASSSAPLADVDVPDVTTSLGDDLARRAFIAAIFSLIFVPLAFYSAWLLIKLMTYSGELSPSSLRKVYAAMVLDGISLLLVLGFVGLYR